MTMRYTGFSPTSDLPKKMRQRDRKAKLMWQTEKGAAV